MKCVVTFSNNRGNYHAAAYRLVQSIYRLSPWIPVIHFTGESQVGAPLHSDNPYAFKLYAIARARAKGYTEILYLDSSVYAVRDIMPVFDVIEHFGYLMQESGHFITSWISDEALALLGKERQDFTGQLMYGNAGMLGLNFNNVVAREFFHEWWGMMEKGVFRGDWSNHRHDMTAGSIVANRLKMQYIPGDQVLQYAAPDDKPNNGSVIFYAQGI